MLFEPVSDELEIKIRNYDKDLKLVFTSQSALNLRWTRFICKYVIDQGYVPVNFFTVFSNFIHELADQQTMIDLVNALIVRCDQLWVFGDISEGVWAEIKMSKELGIPIKYLDISSLPKEIVEIEQDKVKYTPEFEAKIVPGAKFVRIEEL